MEKPKINEKALPNLPKKEIEPLPYIVKELPRQQYRDFVQDGKPYIAITTEEVLAELLILMRRIDRALMGRLSA